MPYRPTKAELEAELFECVMAGFEKYGEGEDTPDGMCEISFDIPLELRDTLKRMAREQGVDCEQIAIRLAGNYATRLDRNLAH